MIPARRTACGLCLGFLLVSPTVLTQKSYQQELAVWRQQREKNLQTDNSWLTVAGLFFLQRGTSTFGSGPANDLVLPAGAPVDAGVLEFDGRRVRLRAKQPLMINGVAMAAAELRPGEGQRPADQVTMGSVSFFVMRSGDRVAIRVRDLNSARRTAFTRLKWYAPNEAYSVRARFEPYRAPRKVRVPNILGDLDPFDATGLLAFTIGGQALKLEAYELDGATNRVFFIVFKDLTSGRETYPAARFLNADLPKANGETVLDFNRAYNPPCAYNPYTTCPLPTPQNRLPVRVEAGELIYQ
jgi:uncharacterized protein